MVGLPVELVAVEITNLRGFTQAVSRFATGSETGVSRLLRFARFSD